MLMLYPHSIDVRFHGLWFSGRELDTETSSMLLRYTTNSKESFYTRLWTLRLWTLRTTVVKRRSNRVHKVRSCPSSTNRRRLSKLRIFAIP